MESIRKLDKKLGIGARGVVYQGFDEENGWFVAIKEIPLIGRSFANGGTPLRPSHKPRAARVLDVSGGEDEGESALDGGVASSPLGSAYRQPYLHSRADHSSTTSAEDASASRLEEEEEAAVILREIHVLERATHPHLVRYYGMRRSTVGVQIIMEYVGGGSLESLLKRCGALRERVVRRYTRDILRGLLYLHETMKVCHRDVKPGNVLLTTDGACKLTDFGVSKALGAGGTGSSPPSSRPGRSGMASDVHQPFMRSTVGTPWYMAPEVISGGAEDSEDDADDVDGSDLAKELRRLLPRRHREQEGYSTAADIWSLGVTVFEMLCGERPFGRDLHNPTAVLFQIVTTAATETPQLPAHCHTSQGARDFLDLCFVYDRTLRPSARELLAHAWFRDSDGEAESLTPHQNTFALRDDRRDGIALHTRQHAVTEGPAQHGLLRSLPTRTAEPSKFTGALDALDVARAGPLTTAPPAAHSARQPQSTPRTPMASYTASSGLIGPNPSSSARSVIVSRETTARSRSSSPSPLQDPAATRYALLREHASKKVGTTSGSTMVRASVSGGRVPAATSSTGMWTRDGYYVDLMSADPLDNL